MLSGDVHAASAFTIRQRRGRGVVRQFTSSALTHPHTPLQALANLVAVRAPNLFEPDFHFRRHLLVLGNNYGLVRVTPLPEGGHRVEFRVRAWQPRTRSLGTAGRLITRPSVRAR